MARETEFWLHCKTSVSKILTKDAKIPEEDLWWEILKPRVRNFYAGRLQGSQWDWREAKKTLDKHPVSNAGLGLGRPGALLRRPA